jgi:hypothetical protein
MRRRGHLLLLRANAMELGQSEREALKARYRQARLEDDREACRQREDVADLRERVAAAGIQLRSKTDPVMFARVLDHVRDIDLAAQAILMEPRPQWVRTLIGADLMKVYPRA